MNKLIELLKSPYPSLCQRWKIVLISSVIVFLILWIFQPFGISKLENKLWILLGYGIVSSIVLSVIVYLFPLLFPHYYKDTKWTLGKHLLNTLLVCVLMTMGIFFYTSWVYDFELQWRIFILCCIWVLILAPFPIVFFVMWNRNLLLARNLKEATEINFHLSRKMAEVNGKMEVDGKGDEAQSNLLTFFGGTKEMLEISADSLLYIEAEGNYVKVSYKEGQKTKQKMLRATMKQAEAAIDTCPFILRCHRAFLVNIHSVVKVDGNSQGYRLVLKDCADEVPVSRAYAKKVQMRIENQ